MRSTVPLSAVCSGDEMESQAADLWTGCDFGCRYCLPVGRRWAREYSTDEDAWALAQSSVRPRAGDLLNDAVLRNRLANGAKAPPVFLSIMSDPYPRAEAWENVTRDTITTLHRHGVGVRLLTKSGTRAVRDFRSSRDGGVSLTSPELGSHPDDAFGATLTFISAGDSRRWEPGAAPPADRMAGLEEAHRRGIPTWASLTPVIDPRQSLELIRQTSTCVDLYSIGALEDDAITRSRSAQSTSPRFDWDSFASEAIALCTSPGVACYVRKKMERDAVASGRIRALDRAMSRSTWQRICGLRHPRWESTSAWSREASLAGLALRRYRV